LSAAQTAIARILGFASWFAVEQAARQDRPILPAAKVASGSSEYLQMLTEFVFEMADTYNVSPGGAARFFHGWGVFAEPLLSPETPVFEQLAAEIEIDVKETGDCPDDEGLPIWAASDIIEVQDVKHRYWFPSPKLLAAMPPYFRGDWEQFLCGEDALRIVLSFPERFSDEEFERAAAYLRRWEPCLYEWHFGKKANAASHTPFAEIVAGARKRPSDWFALSVRTREMESAYPGTPVVAAMRGAELLEMVEKKGALRLCDVRWLEPRNGGLPFELTRALNLKDFVGCAPVYAYPFKHGPFGNNEYHPMVEGGASELSASVAES
jgi:hypothetical protein